MSIGTVGYSIAAVVFGLFALLLLRRRNAPQGVALAMACCATVAWAATSVWVTTTDNLAQPLYQLFEILRFVAWGVFLLSLVRAAGGDASAGFVRRASWGLGLAAVVVLGGGMLLPLAPGLMSPESFFMFYIVGHLSFPIAGLVLVEHLARSADARYRWEMKFLFLALVGLFAYDLVTYSGALLFGKFSAELWYARGWVNTLAVPLLAVAIARNRGWSPSMFVSRDIVFHSTTLFISGLYLIAAAGAGYYVNSLGGTWGGVAQILVWSLALVALALVVFSSQLRAQLRVFLGKHFFQNKYDYRQQWLRLTQSLANPTEGADPHTSALCSLATMVDARSALLWLEDGERGMRNVAAWQLNSVESHEAHDSPLLQFLRRTGYVVTVPEVPSREQEYQGLVVPKWLKALPRAWLVMPLFHQARLIGMVVLGDPLVKKEISWEDRDLLKAAAQHVASHLAGLQASEALAEARQFEAFNRLSAFMVHDLKNVAAELDLIDRNAQQHKHNPAFIEDAFATVRNAAKDIQRMVEQFKSKRAVSGKAQIVDVNTAAAKVVAQMQSDRPAPTLVAGDQPCFAAMDAARFSNVLRHLIDNAQQATPPEGAVVVRITGDSTSCRVAIEDTGCGMAPEFVRTRLFKPFDTTKGNAGMGIGMFESREFIRSLGGEVDVASVPGKGTTVTLTIPLRKQEHDRSDVATAIGY